MRSRPFVVQLTREAEKDLERLRSGTDRAIEALLALESNPDAGHPLKGSLHGARSLEFSLPGGAHRAVYLVLEAEQVCLVFLVGPHEGLYQKADRRMAALRRTGRTQRTR